MLDLATAYEQHAAQIRRYVACRVPLEDIDDVCSTVWLSAARDAATYEERGYAITAWLYCIARSRCADHARLAARRREIAAIVPLTERSALYDAPVEPCDLLWGRLSTRHQRVLWLCAAGYDMYAAARILGTTPAAYKAVLHRAREKAKEVYAG
jgi:DNA-directed RNA polymerase specialized sigma24 family protein